ncbi:MAG: (d)CMP kinase [Sphingobacteriales bacterium]|nr:MAG: (d)CMP kinase [Sphingobacteriales bacterium]TAF78604.1 MAG: (d)CMP kinase [Sphingobacteriales bacterium]
MKKNIVIAIDGYSSCGKSTLAKTLAQKLNYIYIDSGAMYRAVTLYFIRQNVDLISHEAIVTALKDIDIDFDSRDYQSHVLLNGEDVSEEIRQMHVSQLVSQVSAINEVRQSMVKQQQKMGKQKNIVMDGRDIGTFVFPDANLKLFMTADPKTRAERRYKEAQAKGENISLEAVFDNLAHRDFQDTTRLVSPLVRANDAIVLDNTNLNQAEQLAFAMAYLPKNL